jgi:hypothetical protein
MRLAKQLTNKPKISEILLVVTFLGNLESNFLLEDL